VASTTPRLAGGLAPREGSKIERELRFPDFADRDRLHQPGSPRSPADQPSPGASFCTAGNTVAYALHTHSRGGLSRSRFQSSPPQSISRRAQHCGARRPTIALLPLTLGKAMNATTNNYPEVGRPSAFSSLHPLLPLSCHPCRCSSSILIEPPIRLNCRHSHPPRLSLSPSSAFFVISRVLPSLLTASPQAGADARRTAGRRAGPLDQLPASRVHLSLRPDRLHADLDLGSAPRRARAGGIITRTRWAPRSSTASSCRCRNRAFLIISFAQVLRLR